MDTSIWKLGLAEIDRTVAELAAAEERRQEEKIILIPSESLTPKAVREALGSAFTSIYAEGYPREETLRLLEARLADIAEQLAYYRRYSDRRFYKGVEFADLVEALACRRAAECFATEDVPPEAIFVNIQALSGAAANLAIYEALLKPGDTLMAMDLTQGGHLSHGSPFHVSGRRYRIVTYGVDPKSEKLDYDQIADLAKKEKPKMIVAGYTSYPWAPDWKIFREIASSVGAFLFADIAHTAGMAIAGAYPTPVGYADVVMFTTHKTLCGPRGAVILSFDPEIAARIDQAVFPGAQGGPHVNKFAGIAVAFALAKTQEFRRLMFKIVENAKTLAEALKQEGLRLCYGGTNTHLLVLDLRAVTTKNGKPLMGEIAARILDLAGIVANKNTIPGDTSAADARGIRYGTPWVTQRGMGEQEMREIAAITRLVLTEIRPFTYYGVRSPLPRGKIPLEVLKEAQERVQKILARFGVETKLPVRAGTHNPQEARAFLVRGGRAAYLLHESATAHILRLKEGEATRTLFLSPEGTVLAEAVIGRLTDDELGRGRFLVITPQERAEPLRTWLSALADGYVLFDEDIYRKVQGPAVVEDFTGSVEFEVDGKIFRVSNGYAQGKFLGISGSAQEAQRTCPQLFALAKPYFVGGKGLRGEGRKTPYIPEAPAPAISETPLSSWHRKAGARMGPFAGYEMPLWYTSALAEHRAVRERAGLFDLGHMGIFEVSGPYAESFLNLVTTNYAGWLHPGQSQYGFLLDPEGQVIDDLMVYRVDKDKFILIVNAANASKDWDWLNAVNDGRALLDPKRPWIEPDGPVNLRNLKEGADGLVNLALQGPASRAILLKLLAGRDKHRLLALRRTEFLEVTLFGTPIICARTGYTGEALGYELLVPKCAAQTVWEGLLDAGRDQNLTPCGLAARDSLRTEAGLPLYGHELAGPLNILPHEAGFAPYVKLHKAFFVGRDAYLHALENWTREVVRFSVGPGHRPIRAGTPVVDRTGTVVGAVTSSVVLEDGQVGMALVPRELASPKTPLGFVISPASCEEIRLGTRLPLIIWGEVVPRFLRRENPFYPGEE
ncbi:MAG: serine hydroxymethyltransferase [Candidatus Bipolaricaulota bacterium]|nr:serine hydroxymethyltransferase [Candidatus Bipolaricaulota bacterium]MDW8126622.1 serine hydroxymethyltransferase [Candidatus Bipolaricaulota bacterium]